VSSWLIFFTIFKISIEKTAKICYNTQDWGQQRLPVSTMNHKHSKTNNQPRTMDYEQSTTKSQLRKINFFIQNKPNLPNARINVNKVLERDYENVRLHRCPKTKPNKPNSNPIRTRSEAQIPTGKLLGILEPGTKTNPISDYPCVSEFAVYNLVLNNSNGGNFNGDYLKWQMHRRQMQ
jgi:hypothetical protein